MLLRHTHDLMTQRYLTKVYICYLSHTDDLSSRAYDIGVLLLCHRDDSLSYPHEITTIYIPMNYQIPHMRQHWNLCHMDGIVNRPYKITFVINPWGWDSMLSATTLVSYGWDISHPYEIATVVMSYGRVTNSTVWHNFDSILYGGVITSPLWDKLTLRTKV